MEKTHTQFIESRKILDRSELGRYVTCQRLFGYRIVFTNGCFDLLHKGHLRSLNFASEKADKLIVAINSDNSIKQLKGNDRPIQSEENRALVLAHLSIVDRVVIFLEETPYNLIELVKPDVLVKGGDYELSDIVGADLVQSYGGEVLTHALEENYSTSRAAQKLK